MDDTGHHDEGFAEEYARYTHRKVLFVIICLTLSFVSIGLSVTIGGRELSIAEVYGKILDHLMGKEYEIYSGGWMDDNVIWNIRLPRALFAILAGAGLAVSGAAMQSLMKNPLADPYTTGVSSGACFGVAVTTVFGISVMNGGINGMSVMMSFLFAMVPMLFMVVMAPKENTSPATLILAGVAISFLFNSLTSILLTFTDSETLATIYEWQIGSFNNITWDTLYVPLLATTLGSAVLVMLSKKLNILALGDKQAVSLGLNVENLRIILLALSAMIVASIIAYAGIIGFVGLISPHIVRLFIDSDNRFVIPGAALFGGSFLLICDMVARTMSSVGAIPMGVVVSFIGAPMFLYLVIRQKRSMW